MSLPALGKAVRFFQFGYRAYRPRFAELRFDYLNARGGLLRGHCSAFQDGLDVDKDLVALVSTGRGLMLLRQGRLHRLFRCMGYIFGMTLLGDRVYFLHLVQVEGNYKHSEETYRRSEIYSFALSDALSIQDGQKLSIRREYTELGVLYSYCNASDSALYVIDYLGRLSVFGLASDGRLDRQTVRHVMINRHINGAPLRHYAYTHFNAVSVAGQKVFMGAHGRKANSGQFSGMFTIDRSLDPGSIGYTPTPFVHAHDGLVANGDLYFCDSRNGALVRNGERVYVNTSGFMRGLSVMKDRLLVGISLNSDRRAARNRETKGANLLVLLDRDGNVLHEMRTNTAQIYRTLVLSEPDYTVSSFASETESTPDLTRILASSPARDVATYYGATLPPYAHVKIEY